MQEHKGALLAMHEEREAARCEKEERQRWRSSGTLWHALLQGMWMQLQLQRRYANGSAAADVAGPERTAASLQEGEDRGFHRKQAVGGAQGKLVLERAAAGKQSPRSAASVEKVVPSISPAHDVDATKEAVGVVNPAGLAPSRSIHTNMVLEGVDVEEF